MPQLDKVSSLSFRDEREVIHNADRSRIADLDSLPFAAWHLPPMSAYKLPALPSGWGNYAIVVTTGGCPFRCTFCSPRTGQRPYRAISARRVLQMLDTLYGVYGARVFWFSDLSFNVDRSRTEQILDRSAAS